MKLLFMLRCLFLPCICGLLLAPAGAQETAAAQVPGISEGLWTGSLSIRQGTQGKDPAPNQGQQSLAAKIELKLLPNGMGGLLDIPEQSMFGYPLDNVAFTNNRLKFTLDALGPEETLFFDGFFSSSIPSGPSQDGNLARSQGIIGTAASKSWKGNFVLRKMLSPSIQGESPYSIEVETSLALPGTLRLPSNSKSGNYPLAVLVSGAGATDRDGNNYNVPGKTDSIRLLAQGLARKGIASYSFDRRGSGEAYLLEKEGFATPLGQHAKDLAAIITSFSKRNDISRLVVIGMNEGAWISALALNLVSRQKLYVDGFAVLDASGEAPIQGLLRSLEDLGEDLNKEALSIIESILKGEPFRTPSPELQDFFSPGRLAWLAEWLAFDPALEVARVQAPVLFTYGEKNLQIDPDSFELFLNARQNAMARLVPSMNYALKSVGSEEENYQSFTDPGFPVSNNLIELLEAFIKAKPALEGTSPYPRSGQR
jgi:pimeloyl-ACP methyl ester carboxylesterase